MDILDIILAKKLTPQGQIDTYATKAEKAVSDAKKAVDDIESITEQTNTNNTNAQNALNNAQTAAEEYQTLINGIDERLDNITAIEDVTVVDDDTSTYKSKNTVVNKNNTSTSFKVMKNYTSTGNNEDGAMTQKAITDALNTLDQKINTSGGSSGNTNLGSDNAGKIVVVGVDGNITPSTVQEEEIIQALMKSGTYTATDAIGIEVDYTNKSVKRIQEAETYTTGGDFNKYSMYYGRVRCNVNDNGEIVAWQNSENFATDGSNGQVMVYQPKFYYARLPIITEDAGNGVQIVRKEAIIISPTPQNGFKLHPLFINKIGEEVDYVLLSAFEGSAYLTSSGTYDPLDKGSINFANDKLSSVSGVKPISGLNRSLTVTNAERLAENRGTGWHITNLAFESAMQMLEMIEFGTLNGQNALELGIVNIPNNPSYNCASLTGSTISLGNTSGHAASTTSNINNNEVQYDQEGYRAISYRGIENPWGNIWRMIGGVLVNGNGSKQGGEVYVCTNFNYSTSINSNYAPLGFNLPAQYDWISAFGYNSNLDWAFIPIECVNANSALPIGDNLWTTNNLNGTNMAMAGGAWSFGDSCGPFYYAFDKNIEESARAYSARLMFIPEKNAIYLANVQKFQNFNFIK